MYHKDKLHWISANPHSEDWEWEKPYDLESYPCVWLDHSCDEWIIGGKEELTNMIKDLTEILEAMD